MQNSKRNFKMVDPNEVLPSKNLPENNVKIEENIDEKNYLPIENLPSKCRFYPENVKILGRPLNVKEVKLLASMNESNYDFMIHISYVTMNYNFKH